LDDVRSVPRGWVRRSHPPGLTSAPSTSLRCIGAFAACCSTTHRTRP
jgi:hypothetical protein